MKVLAGADGGAAQADAMSLAAQLAAIDDGRVIAVTTERDAGAILDLADEQLRGTPHDLEPVPGDPPAEALHRLARAEQADVLVIGSTHHGRVGRTLLGTTGDHVLHGAPCPVAVAPHGYAFAERSTTPLKRIAVAYDGCREARAALAWARCLTERVGGQLTVVSVADPVGFALDPALPALTSDDVFVSLHKSRRSELDAVVRALPPAVNPAGRLLEGPVAASLCAASGDFDLLVCGSRGHGPVGEVLLGGVSRKLMHESAAPLVIVPRSSHGATSPSGASQEASVG